MKQKMEKDNKVHQREQTVSGSRPPGRHHSVFYSVTCGIHDLEIHLLLTVLVQYRRRLYQLTLCER